MWTPVDSRLLLISKDSYHASIITAWIDAYLVHWFMKTVTRTVLLGQDSLSLMMKDMHIHYQ